MKPRNFPARKLERQLKAQSPTGFLSHEQLKQVDAARQIRTKKKRS
jgi:hypothetical protein